jgi:hypothetical protein
MKNKIVSLLLAFGLSHVALANSAKIGYASDFFYRGEQKALESVQASIDLEQSVASLNASFHLCTNQSIDTGVDSYGIAFGISESFADELFSLYGGFNHFEDVAGDALSEIAVKASLNIVGSPTLSVYRNVDDKLYTFEGSLKHQFDLEVVDLCVHASAGNTDTTESTDRSYYGLGANLSRSVGEGAILSASADLVDADDIDREFVFGTALTFNF